MHVLLCAVGWIAGDAAPRAAPESGVTVLGPARTSLKERISVHAVRGSCKKESSAPIVHIPIQRQHGGIITSSLRNERHWRRLWYFYDHREPPSEVLICFPTGSSFCFDNRKNYFDTFEMHENSERKFLGVVLKNDSHIQRSFWTLFMSGQGVRIVIL
jgi:hypothetical protein